PRKPPPCKPPPRKGQVRAGAELFRISDITTMRAYRREAPRRVLKPESIRRESARLHAPRSHHLSTRSARRVFQRLGAPRRSSSKYVFPLYECSSDQRPSLRCLLRTMSIASARRGSQGASTAWK